MKAVANAPRWIAHLLVALCVAAAAGASFILGMSAALDVEWDPRGAVVLALAAVWIPQTLITAMRRQPHTRKETFSQVDRLSAKSGMAIR